MVIHPESNSRGPDAAASSEPSSHRGDRPGSGESLDELLEDALDSLKRLGPLALDLAKVEQLRIRVHARKWLQKGAALLGLGLFLLVLAVVSATLLIRGVAGGIEAATSSPWIGDFVAGGLALAGIGLVLFLGHKVAERRLLDRLRSEFPEPPSGTPDS